MNDFKYTAEKTILKATNVGLSIDGKTILRDINVDIKDFIRPDCIQGQVTGFLGPSGMGKSKFAEVMAGVITKETTGMKLTGEILVGNPLKPVVAGEVGFVQQKYPLFDHRRVYSNLDIALSRFSLSRQQREERIWDILEKFQMKDHAQKFPAQLSGGQRQRIAIAQQFLCSEHFIILDEPFSGLDPLMVDELCGLIKIVVSKHEMNTVIIISHELTATISVSDTLWMIGRDRDAEGKIIPGAKIQEVYDLVDMNLAWHEDISSTPEFAKFRGHVKKQYARM
jgi:polar amino acid transport system ATP-binding protein/sulfate transport system ATP-binding protein